jgi:hypothetical protein
MLFGLVRLNRDFIQDGSPHVTVNTDCAKQRAYARFCGIPPGCLLRPAGRLEELPTPSPPCVSFLHMFAFRLCYFLVHR